MAKSISFIGSFRKEKHYRKVVECVKLFREKGFVVNSPRGSAVIDSIDDFVIFETDEKGLSPAEIQMITLDKIIHSDVIYVCNVDGYVGKTTCYEIGFCISRKKPLYYLNPPIDLPIPIMDNQVVSPEELLNIAFQGKETNVVYSFNDSKVNSALESIWPSDKSALSNTNKRLVICGSMAFYNQMNDCKNLLGEAGIDAIIPKEENEIINSMNEEEFRNFKRKVSNAYLKKIREKETGICQGSCQ